MIIFLCSNVSAHGGAQNRELVSNSTFISFVAFEVFEIWLLDLILIYKNHCRNICPMIIHIIGDSRKMYLVFCDHPPS